MLKIGKLKFDYIPVLLAPMDGITDPAFRLICKQQGADIVYTEFISSDALIRNIPNSISKLNINDNERPIGIQIYGQDLEPMVESAKMAEAANPEIIDINFGCPVKKIFKRGGGSAMMANVDKMVKITEEIVKAVKLPVTVKTRLGVNENTKNVVDIAERLQDVGIKAITIHGRTREQFYKGEADWTLIGEVKNNQRMQIPVIGNGDITSPEFAKAMVDKYGVDGLMIARASFGNPWIFREVKSFVNNNVSLAKPTINERVEVCLTHLHKSIEVKGLKCGMLEMRRHYNIYFSSLPNVKPYRLQLVTSTDLDHVVDVIEQIRENYQNC